MPELPHYLTVSQLNYYLGNIISAEELLRNMCVMGEVSGLSVSKGNLYCTLKDDDAQISVCCFGVAKTYLPAAGERVLMYGTPEYYQKGGKLSFIASRIEPFGLGKLYRELEELKAKLAEEGLFDERYKLPAPRYPTNVCIVTSISGAVIQDIVSTVRRYNRLINMTVVDVQVQGKGAAEDIARGLALADKIGFDAVILARGGGSFEDLMPFNSERVARAIFAMESYMISAVGHETDFTIADFVADTRALTPTAAAELVAFDTNVMIADIKKDLNLAAKRLENRLLTAKGTLNRETRALSQALEIKLAALGSRVASAANRSERAAEKILAAGETRLGSCLNKLDVLNPANLMKKGWFRALKDGRELSSVSEFVAGEDFVLLGGDGKVRATAKEIIKD